MKAEEGEAIPRSLAPAPTAGGLASRLAVEELKRRAVDPEPLLARCGLSVAVLDRRERIKVKSQIEFLDLASKALREEYLGLSGQGADLLENRSWDGLSDRVMLASYSASRSCRTAAS